MSEPMLLYLLLGYGLVVAMSVLFLKKSVSIVEIVGLFIVLFFIFPMVIKIFMGALSFIDVIPTYRHIDITSQYGVNIFIVLSCSTIPSLLLTVLFIALKKKITCTRDIPFGEVHPAITFCMANFTSILWVFITFSVDRL